MLYLTNKPPDQEPEVERLLQASDGYLALGMPAEAGQELEEVPAAHQKDAAVLRARIRVLLHLRNWTEAERLAFDGTRAYPEENEFVVQRAFALKQQEKGDEAARVISSAPAWIRNTGILHYNLACYEALLGDLGMARQCIRSAIEINAAVKKNARKDPDLKPLWN